MAQGRLQEIGQRLAQIRVSRGDSQEEFAGRLQISGRTYQRYEAGEALPKVGCFGTLSDLGVNLDWLLTGRGAADTPPALADPGPGFVMVPRYEIAAAAGFGGFANEDDPVGFLAFRTDWLRGAADIRPDQAALISATGDSMDPTIRSGDLLLVDLGVTQIMDDAIYVISLSERLMVKRIQRFHDGSVAIRSDNPTYGDDRLTPEETQNLTVAGRVRWIGRMI